MTQAANDKKNGLSFENTEVAFAYKSSPQLKRGYWLFKMVAAPALVKMGKFMLNAALAIRFPVSWIMKPTVFRHFCGGETIPESMSAVRGLEKFNVKGVLDYSVEGKESEEDIRAALEETLRTVVNAAEEPNIPFAVFKPTAFARAGVLEKWSAGGELDESEKTGAAVFEERVETLCRSAYERGIPIMIDAEDYCFQAAIDEVVERMMEKYNKEKAIVYNTLQMYRWDRMDFLRESYEKAVKGNYYLGIKFVRGAYMERERLRAEKMGYKSPIHVDKDGTDRDYDAALTFSIEHIDRISVFNATHNEKSSLHMVELMAEHGIAKDDSRCWFAQLFGMSDHISFNLAHAGYNAAKYVPYGPVNHVMPYLIRRAEENTSVAGQTGRELSLITRELKRRKDVGHTH